MNRKAHCRRDAFSGLRRAIRNVGQTIAFCRLLPWPAGRQSSCLRWGMLELASRPEGRGFSTLSCALASEPIQSLTRPAAGLASPRGKLSLQLAAWLGFTFAVVRWLRG